MQVHIRRVGYRHNTILENNSGRTCHIYPKAARATEIMDPKDKPTIYNFGLEARDACLTEMKKSMSRFASLNQREKSPLNLDDKTTTGNIKKDSMVTPQSPSLPPATCPPPVIRRVILEHERKKILTVQTSPTSDENKELLLGLYSNTSNAEKTQLCVDNNIITVKPLSGSDEKNDHNQCTLINNCSVKESCDSSQYDTQYAGIENKLQKNDSGSTLNLDNDHSTVTSVPTQSPIMVRSLVPKNSSRRKLFMDSPPPTIADCSLLPSKSDTKFDAKEMQKCDRNDNELESFQIPYPSPLQSLPDSDFENNNNYNTHRCNKCCLHTNKPELSEEVKLIIEKIDNIIESYCKFYLATFVFAVLLYTIFS